MHSCKTISTSSLYTREISSLVTLKSINCLLWTPGTPETVQDYPLSFCNLFHQRKSGKLTGFIAERGIWALGKSCASFLGSSLPLCSQTNFYHLCHNTGYGIATIIRKIKTLGILFKYTQETCKTTQIHVKKFCYRYTEQLHDPRVRRNSLKEFTLISATDVSSYRLMLLKVNTDTTLRNKGQNILHEFLSVV